MKNASKTFFIFFFLFLTIFSWQADNIFATGNVTPLGSGEEEKMPGERLMEICEAEPRSAKCLAAKAVAVGLAPFRILGETINGIEKTAENLKGLMSMSFSELFAEIFLKLTEIVGGIVGMMIYIITFLMSPDTFQYATFPAVQAGFYVSLQLASALLAIGMVILADKFILGLESYGNLKSLTRYLVTALLINFSLTFASYGIGISNFLTITFLDTAAIGNGEDCPATAPLSYADRQNCIMDKFSSTFGALVNDKGSTAETATANITVMLVFILFSLFFIVLLAAIAVSLVMRVISLWALLMVIPLALAADTVFGSIKLPGIPIGEGNFQKWMSHFIKWLSFGPIMAGVIFFVFLVMGQMGEAFAMKEYDPSISMLMTTFGETLGLLLALVMLYKGYEFANDNSSAVPKFVDKMIEGSKNWAVKRRDIIRGIPKTAFGKVKEGAGFVGTRTGGALAESRLGRWWQSAMMGMGFTGAAAKVDTARKAAEKSRSERTSAYASQWDSLMANARTKEEKESIRNKMFEVFGGDWRTGKVAIDSTLGRGMVDGTMFDEQYGALAGILKDKDAKGRYLEEVKKYISNRAKEDKGFNAKQSINDMTVRMKQHGVELDANDIFRLNPSFVGNDSDVAEYVNGDKVSGEDMSKFSDDAFSQFVNSENGGLRMNLRGAGSAQKFVSFLKNADFSESPNMKKYALAQVREIIKDNDQAARYIGGNHEAMLALREIGATDVLERINIVMSNKDKKGEQSQQQNDIPLNWVTSQQPGFQQGPQSGTVVKPKSGLRTRRRTKF